MSNDVTILVGDRFEEFARNPRVAKVSDFLVRVADTNWQSIVIGQGLSRGAIEKVAARAVEARPLDGLPEPADRRLTHKHQPKNIMISVPVRREDETYEAELTLDDGNEVMEDHQTGQHIQGLALIEAARQMWTAVTEAYILSGERATRFVLDEVKAKFDGFVFPLPSKLILEVLDIVTTPLQQLFTIRVLFTQAGLETTSIEARYRVIDERVSARQEAVAAQRALAAIVGGDRVEVGRRS